MIYLSKHNALSFYSLIPWIKFSVYVPILQYIYLMICNLIWFSLNLSVLYWIEMILRVSDRSPGRWVIVFWLKKETIDDICSEVIVSNKWYWVLVNPSLHLNSYIIIFINFDVIFIVFIPVPIRLCVVILIDWGIIWRVTVSIPEIGSHYYYQCIITLYLNLNFSYFTVILWPITYRRLLCRRYLIRS